MNKWVASSGEAAIAYAKSCKNVVFIGSASSGMGQYGDCKTYQLINSKIIITLGYKVFQMQFDEGKGYIPDYWIDSSNPLKYLQKWLKTNKI